MKQMHVILPLLLTILLCMSIIGCSPKEELGEEIKLDLQTMGNSCFAEQGGVRYRILEDGIYRADNAFDDFSRFIEGEFVDITCNDKYIFAVRVMNLEKGPEWTYGNLVRFDIDSKNEVLIADNVGHYTFVGDEIVYQVSHNWMMVKENSRLGKHDGDLYRVNMSGKAKKRIVDSNYAAGKSVVSWWEYNGSLYYSLRSESDTLGQTVYRFDLTKGKASYAGESVCSKFYATYENYAIGLHDHNKFAVWNCESCTEKTVEANLPDPICSYYAFSEELSDMFEPKLIAFCGDEFVIVAVPDGYYPADPGDTAAKNYLSSMTKRPYLVDGTVEWFGW